MIRHILFLLPLIFAYGICYPKPISQQLYEEKFRVQCPEASREEINVLSRCNSKGTPTTKTLDQISEQLIFTPIAESELAHYSCLENTFGKIAANPALKNSVVDSTCGQLEELKSLVSNLKYFRNLKKSYEVANDPMIRAVSKEDLQKRDAIVAELNPVISAIQDRISSIQSTDFLLSSGEIFNEVFSQLEPGTITDGKSPAQVCSYIRKNVDKYLAKDKEANAKSKEFLASVFPNGNWLDNSDLKEALWNSASRNMVIEDMANAQSIENSTLCRMDGRYGAGAEIRDRLSLIAKLGLSFTAAGVSRLLGATVIAKRGEALMLAARAAVVTEVGFGLSLGIRDTIRACESKVGTVSARKLCSIDETMPLEGILNKQTALSNCVRQAGFLAFQTALSGFSLVNSFKTLGNQDQIIEAQSRLARIYQPTTSASNTLVITEKAAKTTLSKYVFQKVQVTGGGQIERTKIDAAVRAAEAAAIAKRKVDTTPVNSLPISEVKKAALRDALEDLVNMGGTGPEVAKKNLDRIIREIEVNKRPGEQMVDNFLKGTLTRIKSDISKTNSIQINTKKMELSPEAKFQTTEIRPGASMADLEKNFDSIARKASAPKNKGELHEVDAAFSSGGIATRHISVSKAGTVDVHGEGGDKVFAVGHTGAINFLGKRSNEGGERYYALLYPKGFIRNYGADLKEGNHVTTGTAVGDKFKKIAEEKGKVFVIRKESTNLNTGGQVHLHTSDEFRYLKIDGEVISQIGWMQKNAIGIVEFDHSGRVIMVRSFTP